MTEGMLVVIGVLFIAAILTGMLTRKNTTKNHDEHGIPFGFEENYAVALAPCKDGKTLLYDLTTCRHCARLQEFLTLHGVEYNDVVVDRYIGKARSEIVEKLKSYNPRVSFPTAVFPDGTVIVGYRETLLLEEVERLKEAGLINSEKNK